MNQPLLLTLITGSMQPTINIGDKVYCVHKKLYQSGDIVVIKSEKNFTVHRIVGKFPFPFSNFVLQRGDNELFPKIANIESIIATVIYPELSDSPTKRPEIMEFIIWLLNTLKNRIYS